jgi:hypothetical protein
MKSERGITIIETTVILSVLFILAGSMSPIISESVMTARSVKAKNDASMIAMGLVNIQKDLGADALAFGTAAASGLSGLVAGGDTRRGMPDVLASEGEAPQADGLEDDTVQASTAPMIPLLVQPGNRAGGRGIPATSAQRHRWIEAARESLDDHLRTNRKGYRLRKPGEYGGWNGPYLSAELKGDPWGNQYLVNSSWITGGDSAADSQGRARRAVFVISAGGNGVIETPFEQAVTDAHAYGDDIAIRIQ